VERGSGPTNLFGYEDGVSSSPIDLTPDAGSPLAPDVLGLPGAVFISYEIDKGAGLDIYGQSFCLP